MISKRFLCLVVLIVSTLFIASAAQAEDPLYLLFFGNSFSIGDGAVDSVPALVGMLAVSDGHVAPVIVEDLMNSSTLSYHLTQVQDHPSYNVTNSALPAGETWDYVVMQGYSTEALVDDNGENDVFCSDALALYQAVANHTSGNGEDVTGILFQTWARWNMVYNETYDSMDEMQASITSGYALAHNAITATNASCGIATVGQAFGLMDYDTSLYDDDDYHGSAAGYLLAAMVLYRTIYDEDVSDIEYDESYGVSETVWAQLVAAADAAPIVSPVTSVPEPASISLLGLGFLALLKRRRR